MPLESSIAADSLAVFGETVEGAEAAVAAKWFCRQPRSDCWRSRLRRDALYVAGAFVANSIFGDTIPLVAVRPCRAASWGVAVLSRHGRRDRIAGVT